MASEQNTAKEASGGPPLWKAKTLWIAAALMVVSLGMWALESRNASQGTAGDTSLTTSLVASQGDETTTRPGSSALFRFGASYLAGFFLGWGLRKFLKVTLLISGAVIAGIFVLRHTGMIDLDWAYVQGHVSQSFAWLTGQAGAVKDFVTGYIPSAAAVGVGIFMGVRYA